MFWVLIIFNKNKDEVLVYLMNNVLVIQVILGDIVKKPLQTIIFGHGMDLRTTLTITNCQAQAYY
jgi:hypothetical protein